MVNTIIYKLAINTGDWLCTVESHTMILVADNILVMCGVSMCLVRYSG